MRSKKHTRSILSLPNNIKYKILQVYSYVKRLEKYPRNSVNGHRLSWRKKELRKLEAIYCVNTNYKYDKYL